MRAASRNLKRYKIIPAQPNLCQPILYAEFYKGICRRRDGPPISRMMIDMKVARLCQYFEFLVMISAATAAVFDPVLIVPVVNHLVEMPAPILISRIPLAPSTLQASYSV